MFLTWNMSKAIGCGKLKFGKDLFKMFLHRFGNRLRRMYYFFENSHFFAL